MAYISYETTKDGIGVITIDCAGEKVNKVSSGFLNEVGETIDRLMKGPGIRALVLVSGKEDNFVVGAAIDELKGMKSTEEVTAYITKGHKLLNALEALPVPVVAGIHGSCLGGGLELALVCDYRMATDSPKTQLGLPEVRVGVLPAGGGTQRLPRLVGLRTALPILLGARTLRVKAAKKIGLIDEIVAPHGLREMAVRRAAELAMKGKKRRKRKRPIGDIFLESTFLGRRLAFSQARKMVMRQTHGLYPAPLAVLDATEHGLRKGIKKGLAREIEQLGRLVMSPQSKALMSIFFGMTDLKKNPRKDIARRTGKLAVIGTGLMGQGIAAVSTDLCDTILMKDVSLEAAAKGMKAVWEGLAKRAKSGAMTVFERDVQYGKLVPCDDYSSFKNTDIVIEAVFEELGLKRKVLADAEAATDEKTIFASNTSALPIKEIAAEARRPENVIGMHYFSPVPRMPLLEIITTDKTAPWVTATALRLGIGQGKTCIVVRDGPGFYTTRILAPLLNEAALLVEEGARAEDIDRAMLLFGFPVGPVSLIDEVGIDVAAHVSKNLGKIFSARGMKSSDAFPRLFDKGYHGKKNGKGFYRYDLKRKNGMRQASREAYAILGDAPRKDFDRVEIQQRIALMMVNESLLCFEEGIITCARDGDIGAIFGLGFPPFRGGPFRYIDSEGAGAVLKSMELLRGKHGERFRPAGILGEMARDGKKFYSE